MYDRHCDWSGGLWQVGCVRAVRAAVVLLSACGASAPPSAHTAQAPKDPSGDHHHQHAHPAQHGHGHAHAHDPLVHRFEHAEHWVAQFDDPTRDAWQRPVAVVAAMQIEPGMTVADVGAGTGYFEPHLSRAVTTTGQVLALDIEPDMVRYLNERARREQLSNVHPALAQSDDPKLGAGSVDRVLIVDTWHHVPERVSYAQKLRAALRPGGRIYIVDFTLDAKQGPPREHRLAPELVIKELAQAGLRAELSAPELPEQYVIVATQH